MSQDAPTTRTPPEARGGRHEAARALQAAAVLYPDLYADTVTWGEVCRDARDRLAIDAFGPSAESARVAEKNRRFGEPYQAGAAVSAREPERPLDQRDAEILLAQWLEQYPGIAGYMQELLARHDEGEPLAGDGP